MASDRNITSLLHFQHRRIQSRIVAKVYGANRSVSNVVDAQAQITQLQHELDEWKEKLSDLNENLLATYPYRCV